MKTRTPKSEPQPKGLLPLERSSAVLDVVTVAPIIKRAQINENVSEATTQEKRLKAIIRAHQINCEESRSPDRIDELLTSEKSREVCDAMEDSRKNLEGKPILPII